MAQGPARPRSAIARARRADARGAQRFGRMLAGASLVLLVATSLVAEGCESPPARAWQAAREYGAGTRALDAGDAAEAVARLERAASLSPRASEIRNHLGIAYWQTGRPDRARAEFERALALDCENEAARRNLDSLDAATQTVGEVGGTEDGG